MLPSIFANSNFTFEIIYNTKVKKLEIYFGTNNLI